VPWSALVALSAVTVGFTLLGDLGVISTFASATFLLIFTAVNLSAFRLSAKIGLHRALSGLATLLCGASFVTLVWHTWTTAPTRALWIAGFYGAAIAIEVALTAIKGARKAHGAG